MMMTTVGKVKNAVVVGYGSIGRRHARILDELGCKVSVVSHVTETEYPAYRSLGEALAVRPDYVVVANATADHRRTLEELADLDFRGNVLVEKPLDSELRVLPVNKFRNLAIAYNLRFHPLMRRLHEMLDNEILISAQIYAGQYLPDWRPGTDYRQSYSANRGRGGGVLRDLSHEIDYVTWLCGGWVKLSALGGHLSSLEIDSDDCWAVLLSTERCPVITFQLNYLDKPGHRSLIFNTKAHTVKCDLGAGTLIVDGEKYQQSVERDDSYRSQHSAALSDQWQNFSTVDDALTTMEIIEAVERSAREGTWIDRRSVFAPSVRVVDPKV